MVLLLIAATVIPVFSQGSDSARPSFEVASIKPNNSSSRDADISLMQQRVRAQVFPEWWLLDNVM